jgi:hypothetical protein
MDFCTSSISPLVARTLTPGLRSATRYLPAFHLRIATATLFSKVMIVTFQLIDLLGVGPHWCVSDFRIILLNNTRLQFDLFMNKRRHSVCIFGYGSR